MLPTETVSLEIDPSVFYSFVDLLQQVDEDVLVRLKTFQTDTEAYQEGLAEQVKELQESCRHLASETRRITRRRESSNIPRLDASEDNDVLSGQNFLGLVLAVMSETNLRMQSVIGVAKGLQPGRLLLRKTRFSEAPSNFDEIQHMVMEFRMNLPTITRFLQALQDLCEMKAHLLEMAHNVTDALEKYRQRVQHRHSTEGIEIHGTVVATDVALSIYANVDGHGEIEDGKLPNEVSAYSVRRAQAMAEGIRTGLAQHFISSADQFIKWLDGNLRSMWTFAEGLEDIFKDTINQARMAVPHLRKVRTVTNEQFETALTHLNDVDPNAVAFREKSVLLNPEERWNLNFRNTTLKKLVRLLQDPSSSPVEIIQYVLDRKHELHSYFQGENSFYTCKISAGNVFLGDAPGALQVIPGTRPNVNLDEIFGSGYDEIRYHAEHIEATAKWHDIFVATSPSKSADKSNTLMVGPMGCGKSEVLRGIGADRHSIGIFAQASDFNTCWSGEAQKNPKRLFEAAVKLEKESKKHVHILIDEIDDVLNDDHKPGKTNFDLRREFQILMDGIVHYARITVWGATNNIERIPMPMIRRFSKLVICGELDQKDRVRTLQHFATPLPTGDYPDSAWEAQAQKLEGATGDVIRKVVDHVWREKITRFVADNPVEAESLVRWLNLGEKFSTAVFYDKTQTAAKRRAEFKAILGNHVKLVPEDIDRSIEIALDNVGVFNEIQTAKETYEGARRFLAQVREARGA